MPDGSGLGGDHFEVSIVRTREAGMLAGRATRAASVSDTSTMLPFAGAWPCLALKPLSALYRFMIEGSSVESTLGAKTIPCGSLSWGGARSRVETTWPVSG